MVVGVLVSLVGLAVVREVGCHSERKVIVKHILPTLLSLFLPDLVLLSPLLL